MQQMGEIWRQGAEADYDGGQKSIILGLGRQLMQGKYGDVILLCTVIAAFIMLLAFSAAC
ncbi:MAG TPA: hypothetical protein PLY52_11980 [Methanothrix sp.]|jgi:hypothetical protein|uniref:hypothetical protein n=2 Tax=Methanothrix sp. TaxID=90426 RepID=UPI002BC984C5|nr:hypothetical protein [Methanothrix sp.]MDI9416156.1 hypothetical protein [Euryarchaeota archaeon]HON37009.1 hypothetical protein [Methanothrix sp.]HRU76685.1 hypothetical protein [Methanothrix sp.]